MSGLMSRISTLLAKSSISKSELRDFDKELFGWQTGDVHELLNDDVLETFSGVITTDLNPTPAWEIASRVLVHFAGNEDARRLAQEELVPKLSQALLAGCKVAKGDRQISYLLSKGRVLAVLSFDGAEANFEWASQLAALLKEALEKAVSRGAFTESYVALHVTHGILQFCRQAALASFLCDKMLSLGCIQQLHRLCLRLLDSELTGIPKIVAEQSLMMLDMVHSEKPDEYLRIMNAEMLASSLVDVASKCNWVQSQELAIVFLARLVYTCRCLEPDFLSQGGNKDMLHLVISSKSSSLKIKAMAFVSMLPSAIFSDFEEEFAAAVESVAIIPARTLKTVLIEVGRNIWGTSFPLNSAAKAILQGSELMTHVIPSLPPNACPPAVVDLLPPESKAIVIRHLGYNPMDDDSQEGWGEGEDEGAEVMATEEDRWGFSLSTRKPVWNSDSVEESPPDEMRGASAGNMEREVPGPANGGGVYDGREVGWEKGDAAGDAGSSGAGAHAVSSSGRPLIKSLRWTSSGNGAAARTGRLTIRNLAGAAGEKAEMPPLAVVDPTQYGLSSPAPGEIKVEASGLVQPYASAAGAAAFDSGAEAGTGGDDGGSHASAPEELSNMDSVDMDADAKLLLGLTGLASPSPKDSKNVCPYPAVGAAMVTFDEAEERGDAAASTRESIAAASEKGPGGDKSQAAAAAQGKSEEGKGGRRASPVKLLQSVADTAQAALALAQLQKPSLPALGGKPFSLGSMPPPPPALSKAVVATASLAGPSSPVAMARASSPQEDWIKKPGKLKRVGSKGEVAATKTPGPPKKKLKAGAEVVAAAVAKKTGSLISAISQGKGNEREAAVLADVSSDLGKSTKLVGGVKVGKAAVAAALARATTQGPALPPAPALPPVPTLLPAPALSPAAAPAALAPAAAPAALAPVAAVAALALKSAPEATFGKAQVQELNRLVDDLYMGYGDSSELGQKVIENLVEGAANVSSIVALKLQHILTPEQSIAMDEDLNTIKRRVQTVCRDLLAGKSLTLLHSFSEMVSQESGVVRRDLEQQLGV